jgi:hypothetical protein
MSASTPLSIDHDLEKANNELPPKKLSLWWSVPNAVTEWRNGNKLRVVKYCVGGALAGATIGVIIVIPILVTRGSYKD